MPSFPASKYARYKRATSFFLDWLLRVRGRGRRAGGKRVQLDEFNEVIKEIAAQPSILTPKLLQELPKALTACQCAITYREHVAAFFAEDNEAQVGHRHFVELLRGWSQTLQALEMELHEAADEVKRFENYYDVLELDEDYFPDEETFVKGKEAPKRAEADRKRLFDQAFDEDMRLEVASFFLELEELVKEVFNVYDQVKKQQRTMMEATVVVNLAVDMADALMAGLQVRYPALQTAEDLLFVLMDSPSTTLQDQVAKASRDVREMFEKDGTYTFVPGMLLNDFSNVWWTLAYFMSAVGMKEDKSDLYWNLLSLPDKEKYNEERTPQQLLPDSDNMVPFLLQQLPMLYNAIRWKKKKKCFGAGYKREKLVNSYVALFQEYFQTRKVTVPLVFFCICWIKSVVALQGDAGLSRNISLTIQHSEKLMEKMEASLEKGETGSKRIIYDGTSDEDVEKIAS
ncbi:Drug/Metabolite Transporter (DMT) Superfamily [Phytophthora cinnamomi]|uniref:Drug/Metabolite Transporter (DMT) Superfamily n=1 Tax=Phytophthora cinnamomi TaxID=4785 RepID=UPI00355A02D9|nr:Drug/Metabolite Transporter (DMT) Superfamily [Phytophthora cinnamomi]